MTLCDVLYIPQVSIDLILVSELAVSGYGKKFEGSDCVMYKVSSDSVALKLKRTGRSYKATATAQSVQMVEAKVADANN